MSVVSSSVKRSVNEPLSEFKAAEQPEVLPGLCLDAEVITTD